MNIEENKEYFKTLCKHHIKREGINDLLNWLEDTDFYTAPASTKYHLAVKGGLCQHSLNVFHMMVSEVKSTLFPNKDIPPLLMEEVAILALFHDFVKINFYEEA